MILIDRFLSWLTYREKLRLEYKMVVGKKLPFMISSETAEVIIGEYKLFYNRTPEKRFKDEWDKLIEDIDD